MNDYLQQIHSLFSSLTAVGENILDKDLVAQTLLGLPHPYDPFITVINATNPRPTFAALRQLLLNEEDRVKNAQKHNSAASSSMLLYSNAQAAPSPPSFKPNPPKPKPRLPKTKFTNYQQKSHNNAPGVLGSPPPHAKQLCQICEKGR